MKAGAVIVAAGSGSRMKSNENKQYLLINEKAMLERTLLNFIGIHAIDEIVVVIREEDLKAYKILATKLPYKNTHIRYVFGGKTRLESVYNGLCAIPIAVEIVAIHDGARPFTSQEIIIEAIQEAKKYIVSCVAVPVKDTIKRVNDNHIAIDTLDRKVLWAAQTPQTIQLKPLLPLYKQAIDLGENYTDDASIAEANGIKVKMVMGSYDNIKITTAEDMLFAEIISKKFDD